MSTKNIETAFRLTPLQEGMLYHTIRHPDSSVYSGQCTCALTGPMDDRLFQRAWQLAAERHQAFRTFYAWERRERPLQVVRERVELAWEVLDWSSESEADRERLWGELLDSDAGRPFVLAQAPVMRFVLVHLGQERHRLLWSLHHALADGWSGMLVFKEVMDDYGELRRGSEPDRPTPPSFATFVTWLDSRDADAAETYWRKRLAGFVEPTPLPAAPQRGAGNTRATVEVVLDERATPALYGAAARLRVTPNTIAVGAWALILARYTFDSDEVVFGVTISERPPEIPGVERSVGLYLSTVPVRVTVPDERSVADWLRDLQCTLSDGRDHSSGGLGDIQRWSDLDHAPDLVRSLVVFESFPPDVVAQGTDNDLQIDSTTISAPSDLPLALLVYPAERLTVQLVYDPSLYDEVTARRLLDEATRALVTLTDTAEAKLGDIEVMEPEARSVLFESWSGADLPQPAAPDVMVRFEEQAAVAPNAIAVRAGESEISYGALDRTSNLLAHRIIGQNLGADSLLGIPAIRSIETVVAVLAALKSGHGYTLFDPEQPDARLAAIVRHVDLILTHTERSDRGPRSMQIGPVDAIDEGPVAKPDTSPTAETTAYVVWTSGSTGTPKGVVVERGHLARSTAARLISYQDEPERFLLMSSLAVDSAVAGLFWTLCSGGCLILPPLMAEQDSEGLARLIEDEVVTTTLLIPSLYRMLLAEADADILRSFHAIIVAGESCPPGLVAEHFDRLPNVRLFNEYGPSEATVWATVDELDKDPERPPSIGRPVPFVRVYLLDAVGRAVPVGAPGEICLGGDTVARGYLDQAELTAARFVEDPFREGGRMYRTGDKARFLPDGRLEFLGRLDGQLKIRGFRVEPEEIERVLARGPGVSEAAVLAVEPIPATDTDSLVARLIERAGPNAEDLLSELLEGG